MTYKLVVLDMDDTLMTSENIVSPRTEAALVEAQAAGIQVVLASGRPTNGMVETAKKLKLDVNGSVIISYNGARVFNMKDMSLLSEASLSKEQFDHCYDYCRSKGFFVLTYIDEHIVYEGEHPYMNIESELTGLPMKKVDDLKQFVRGPVPKMMGIDLEEHITAANQELNGSFMNDIHVTTSKPYFLEFMTMGVSKGRALHELAQQLNVDREEIIAFGDSNNDKDMIEYAGLGVAMGNANEAIKAAADLIAEHHDEDGIADVINEYILKK